MGRGRQKAKATRQAREMKYFSPETDYSALERELSSAKKTKSSDSSRRRYDDEDDYSAYAEKYPVSALNVSLNGTYFAYHDTSSHRNNRFILHPRLFYPRRHTPHITRSPAPDISLRPMRGECLCLRLTHKTGFREGTVQVMTSRTGSREGAPA